MTRIAITLTAIITAFLSAPTTSARSTQARQLTFEDRVRAQEAIERVYYAHQIGATKPFEEAVPLEALERKVHTYLKQTVALETLWNTPVNADSLRTELERAARNTRFPDRLQEIYAALDHDPVLVLECFARPLLVDRLGRNFFASDARSHAEARADVETLHERLVHGEIDVWAEHPNRSVAEFSIAKGSAMEEAYSSSRLAPTAPIDDHASEGIELDPDQYRRVRRRAPDQVGEIGEVVDERDVFVIRVVLSETEERMQVASYAVSKITWDAWWASTQGLLDGASVETVIESTAAWSLPAGVGQSSVSNLDVAGCIPDDTWNNGILDAMPSGRRGHTAVWTGSLMIIWGGYDSSRQPYANSGGRYDPLTDTWAPTSRTDAPSGRASHTAVWTGSLMVVWGGYRPWPDYELNSGGRYDPILDTWTPTSTINAPSERESHTAVWTGDLMVVWGGYGRGSLNSGGRYNPVTDTWTPTSTINAPYWRDSHTAVWTGSLMVVWGGSYYDISGGRYDPVTDTWTPTSTINAPSGRSNHTAVWTGSLMVIWGGDGGYPDEYLDSGGRYDPVTDSWTQTSMINAPVGRYAHTAIWTGSLMVIWGGYSYGYQHTNTGGRYDPVTDSWTPTSTTNAPLARSIHAGIWTGSLMVVWGGYGSGSDLNTGGRYDPVMDTWTPTSTTNSPVASYAHKAIWTGSIMVIWGGYTGFFSALNSGGRYDPLTDTWAPTSMTNVPSARAGHTAVWTGTLMVVWGGSGLNSGGRYDPVTDTWTPTSMTNAPSARAGHSSVWTGSFMVVWGGGGVGNLNSGGRYNPVTDTWTPTSTANAPSARNGHTAVWTRSLMVVWGGSGGGNLNSGGRYDPVTDTWTPTSTANAPFGRYYHTAVWTGSLMIAWGGTGGGNTGGRYDPTTDTWALTSTTNAPSGRYRHTAVWTGRIMIVWGGDGGSFLYHESGGRYDPVADTWTPTSTINAPSGRDSHTAVWTGDLMLVWGGSAHYGSEYSLNSGGRYAIGQSTDDDGDGFSECAGDCDDSDPAIHPGATEICNGLDDDCDGATDEDLGSTTCGVGACTVTVDNCMGGPTQTCVPGTPTAEVCNGLDDDCDGTIDEGLGPGTVEVVLDPVKLWPPNHRMVDIHATVSVVGGCPSACLTAPVVILASAISNEPDDADGVGDGQTVNDIQEEAVGSASFDFKLRAERDGTGDGRLYQVTYMATDCLGGTSVGYGGVLVPHDEGGQTEPLVMDVVPQSGGGAGSYALEWNPIAGATGYNVVRGRMSSIRAVGSFTVIEGAGCLAHGLTTTSVSGALLDENPAPGEAFFYLTEYVKGTNSGYGTEASGREMIIGSGDSCH